MIILSSTTHHCTLITSHRDNDLLINSFKSVASCCQIKRTTRPEIWDVTEKYRETVTEKENRPRGDAIVGCERVPGGAAAACRGCVVFPPTLPVQLTVCDCDHDKAVL